MKTQWRSWGAHLAWSGDHQLRFDTKSDGRRYLQAEALYQAGECQLVPGARQETPWLYAAYGAQGINDISLAFHQFVRRHLLTFPGASTRPVQLNTWEGVYFDHDPAYIMAMATEAVGLGVERFIIDDGWFLHRRDDRAGLGDWYVDRTQYPDGLQPVIAHVHQQGMQFGLWVEPEMINPDSDLYRAHPD